MVYTLGRPCFGNTTRNFVIQFTCDLGAGIGSPQLISSHWCQQIVHWTTAAACSVSAQSQHHIAPHETPCVATDSNGNQYDLSPLINNRRNYEADPGQQGNHDYQINVCRSLVAELQNCKAGSGACDTTSNTSLGLIANAPYFDSNNQLVVDYVMGEACPTGNGLSSSRINFLCARDSQGNALPGVVGTPTLLSVSSNCEYLFEWRTSFACASSEWTGANCQVTDRLSGNLYNMASLRSTSGQGYTVTSPDGRVSFNVEVCGAAASCHGGSGACFANNATSIGAASSALQFVDQGLLELNLNNGVPCSLNTSTNVSTSILFVCDGTDSRNLTLNHMRDCYYEFQFQTLLACPPVSQVICTAVDSNSSQVYDLSPLMSRTSNWIAPDTRENSKYLYLINVCGSLVPNSVYPNCPHNASACQVSEQHNTFSETSLGELSGSPVFANGKLFIEYPNGDYCGSTARRTRINFYCSPSADDNQEVLGNPIFIEETGCVYEFAWYTSLACPCSGSGSGSGSGSSPSPDYSSSGDCQVRDIEQGVIFDLSPLSGQIFSASNADSDPSGHVYMYDIGVCKALASCGNGVTSSGACQFGSSAVSLGNFSTTPFLQGSSDDGAIMLRYEGGSPCTVNSSSSSSTTKSRSTLLVFTCDETAGLGQPEFVQTTSDCTYVFSWRTNVTCYPVIFEESCVAAGWNYANNKFAEFDLSPLTRGPNDSNWQALDEETFTTYKLNICGLLSNPPAGCRDSAVCKTTAIGESTGIGRLAQPPAIRNGETTLRYYFPAPNNCSFAYTQIQFNCYPRLMGSPVFVSTDGCVYLFTWDTFAACQDSRVVANGSRLVDPDSGLTFDLTPLQGHFLTFTYWGNEYFLAVLSTLTEVSNAPAACIQANTALCEVEQSSGALVQWGAAPGNFTYGDGVLSLEYSFPSCRGNSSRQTSVTVLLTCDQGVVVGSPDNFQSIDDCTILFELATKYACENVHEVDCVVQGDGVQYDLSPLTKQTRNWQVVQTGNKVYDYYINICHNINDMTFLNATENSIEVCEDGGLCQVTIGSNPSFFNLGGVTSPSIQNGQLVIVFQNGGSCGGVRRVATVRFVCGKSTFLGYPLGRPEFIGENSTCNYTFRWITPAACAIQLTKSSTPVISDPLSGAQFDLSALSGQWTFVADNQQSYTLSLFSDTPACSNFRTTAVCQLATDGVWYSLGSINHVLQLFDSHIFMNFTGGTPCTNGPQRSSSVEFVCDPCSPADSPEFDVVEESCFYTFSVYTILACVNPDTSACSTDAPSTASTKAPSHTTPTAAPQASAGHSGHTGLAVGIVVVVLIIMVMIVVGVYIKRRNVASHIQFPAWCRACCGKKGDYKPVSHFYLANESYEEDDDPMFNMNS